MAREVVARSPYPEYCVGHLHKGVEGSGYYMGLVLGGGKAVSTLSEVLDGIVAFDRAEVEGTFIGQINMITVSSFCGPEGKVWGLDIATQPDLREEKLNMVGGIPVYSAKPLLAAATELWGTVEQKHFPFYPGSHVMCAEKSITKKGVTIIYAALGLGIPQDRATNACLMMEDVGEVGGTSEEEILHRVAQSILLVGENQRVKYKEMFVAVKTLQVGAGEVGCALVAAPYFALAKNWEKE